MAGEKKGSSARTRIPLLLLTLLAVPLTLSRVTGPNPAVTTPATVSSQPRVADPAATPASLPASENDAMTWCRARFLAPLQTYASFDRVGAWDASPSDYPRAPGYAALRDAAVRDVKATAATMEVVVATVPDPIDSGLGYYFDSVIEALQLGIEREHYLRDQWWLPWVDAQLSDRAFRPATEACRREVPGVILFRRQGNDLLVLLVVGETPTYGVQKAALREALSFADAYASDASTRGYRIVGPSFSGSAESMARVIAASPERPVHVRTGSATAKDVAMILRRSNPGLDFKRTTIREDDLQCAFYRYLARTQLSFETTAETVRLPHVAVLRESGTAFGAQPTDDKGDGPPCEFTPEVDLQFPLHVSSIRNAYQAEDPRKPSTSEDLPVRRTSLDVSMSGEEPRDSEAPSSQTTAAGHDVALANLLTEISREGLRYVGIQATDSADAIFLARKLRDVAPDVRLTFFGSDALLLDPEFEADLVGSYMVSPYPFFGSNDFRHEWDGHGGDGSSQPHEHLAFLGGIAEGTFNATVATVTIDEPPSPLEYEFFQAHDGRPVPPLPVWIAAIGANEAVPVAVRLPDDCAGDIYAGEPPDRDVCDRTKTLEERRLARSKRSSLHRLSLKLDPDMTPPRLWQCVYGILMAAVLVDWRRDAKRRASCAPTDPTRAARQTKLALYDLVRSVVVAFVLAFMLVLQRLAIAAYGPVAQRCVPLVLMLLGAAALVAAMVSVYGRFRRFRAAQGALAPPSDRAGARPWICDASNGLLAVTALLSLLLATLTVVELGRVWVTPRILNLFDSGPISPHSAMFVLRTLPLLNRVSPAAPILASFGCIYAWAWGHAKRLVLLDGLAALCPPTAAESPEGRTTHATGDRAAATPIAYVLQGPGRFHRAGVRESELELVRALERPASIRPYFVAVGVLALVPVLVFTLNPPSAIEDFVGKWILLGLIAVSTVCIGSTLVQFVLYWHRFDRLLGRLGRHPTSCLLGQVATALAESVESQISRPSDDLDRLASCVARFEDLVATDLPKPVCPERDGSIGQRLLELPRAELDCRLRGMEAALVRAMRTPETAGADASLLAQKVLEPARYVNDHLESVWRGDVPGRRGSAETESSKTSPDAAPFSMRMVLHEAAASPRTDLARPDAQQPDAQQPDARQGDVAWIQGAHAYVATVVALLLNRHVRQFKVFVSSLTGQALLLLLAVSTYVFEPKRLLLTCMWFIMLSVVGTGIYVYVQLGRNGLLSRIAGSVPGEVDINAAFISRIVTWGILPLLTVAAAQYPQVANFFFSWLEPFTKAMH